MLKITNTLTGKKEQFVPLHDKKVLMYVCGITPYDYAHLGHGRAYVVFDLLYRFLKFLDYDVTYTRNFTDIDDKLLARAEKELGDPLRYKEVADKFIAAYHQDMQDLGTKKPDYEPRVTETIPEIIAFIKDLIDAGKAYESNGDVYFSIQSFPEYCKLSKQKLDELRAGARVEVSSIKKDPLDFALWKAEKEGTFWQSPWGWGRPGWHIECSAMASKFLGDQIDIHGGGADLIFPHHENEIAQSEARSGKQFSKYWLHNAFVTVNKEKMSKSLGNFFTLKDIFKEIHPMAVRYYILSHSYRAPLDFSLQDLEVAQKTYQRLAKFFTEHQCTQTLTDTQIKQNALVQKMVNFLLDDLNTSGMLGVVFEHLSDLPKNQQDLCAVKYFLQEVLGLPLIPFAEEKTEITPEIQKLIDEREAAREAKDWSRADALREQLKALGVEVQDRKQG